LGHAEYNCARSGLRHFILFDHKWFAIFLADYYSAFHTFLLLLDLIPLTTHSRENPENGLLEAEKTPVTYHNPLGMGTRPSATVNPTDIAISTYQS
jgi:hypothetical protein